MTAFGRY